MISYEPTVGKQLTTVSAFVCSGTVPGLYKQMGGRQGESAHCTRHWSVSSKNSCSSAGIHSWEVWGIREAGWKTMALIKGFRTSDLGGKVKTIKSRWLFFTHLSHGLFKSSLSKFCAKTWHLVPVHEACVCPVTLLINTICSWDSSHIFTWFTTGLWDSNYSVKRRMRQEGISREFTAWRPLSKRLLSCCFLSPT